MKINDIFLRNHRPYIIAEISQNHDGSLGQAHAYIDAVAEAGADAVKFQTHIAHEESTIHEPFRVKFSYEDATRYDYWKRMEFTESQWEGLYQHAAERKIDFLSSPFSIKALQMLDKIGVSAWKFGAGEVFNSELMDAALKTGKPLLLSTGLSTKAEVDEIVEKIKKNGNFYGLFQCVTAYPSKAEDININLIQEFKERYQCPIGISDHSATIYPALAATALGAELVEIHVTMSHYMFGPDVKASVSIEDLKRIVQGCDFIHRMKNSTANIDTRDENRENLKNMFSKSVYYQKSLKKGSVIQAEDLALKKPYVPGSDSVTKEEMVGKKLLKDVCTDDLVNREDVV